MKKTALLFLLLVLSLSLASCFAMPKEEEPPKVKLPGIISGEYGDVAWSFDEKDGALTLSVRQVYGEMGWEAVAETVEIPDFLWDSTEGWLSVREQIVSLNISEGITSVGAFAFADCTALTKVAFPDGMREIGYSAFQNCNALTEITLPDSITRVGEFSFFECENLKTLDFGNGLQEISDYAFAGCYNLSELPFPESLTHLGAFSFFNCRYFKEIVIPNGVEYIGKSAFRDCSMPKITIPFVGETRDGSSNNYFGHIFGANGSGSQTEAIPKSLERVNVTGGTVIPTRCFSGCDSIVAISLPDTVWMIEDRAFSNCTSLKIISVPEGVASIGMYAFGGCSSLVRITLPSSLVHIGTRLFYDCTSLLEVRLLGNMSKISDGMFVLCESIKSFAVPDGVTSIGRDVFSSSGVESITIPKTVRSIGESNFDAQYSQLKTVYYEGGAEEWRSIGKAEGNEKLSKATVYYYSETQPTTAGNFWRYVNGYPKSW